MGFLRENLNRQLAEKVFVREISSKLAKTPILQSESFQAVFSELDSSQTEGGKSSIQLRLQTADFKLSHLSENFKGEFYFMLFIV